MFCALVNLVCVFFFEPVLLSCNVSLVMSRGGGAERNWELGKSRLTSYRVMFSWPLGNSIFSFSIMRFTPSIFHPPDFGQQEYTLTRNRKWIDAAKRRLWYRRLRTDSTGDFPTIFAMADMASSLCSKEVVIVDFDLDGCCTGSVLGLSRSGSGNFTLAQA